MESSERPGRAFERRPNIEDYHDAPFYHLLLQFPEELALRYIKEIELESLNDTQTFELLENAAAARKEALTVSFISDKQLYEAFEEHQSELFHDLETDVYTDHTKLIGSGTTARVKYYEPSLSDTPIRLAIKYVITPNEETVPAAEEHNILHKIQQGIENEVTNMRAIEEIEKNAELQRFKVPHPYLHHKTETLQCYGMEYIDGMTLEQGMQDDADHEKLYTIKAALENTSLEEIEAEIDVFFERMHREYLHRDIKSGNIMVDTNGIFYLIDFGNSAPISQLSPQAREELDTSKQREVYKAKESLHNFFRTLFDTRA